MSAAEETGFGVVQFFHVLPAHSDRDDVDSELFCLFADGEHDDLAGLVLCRVEKLELRLDAFFLADAVTVGIEPSGGLENGMPITATRSLASSAKFTPYNTT